MYERFTDRARKVMRLANEEALRVNHEYIGTEHILLGLIKENHGVAAHVLMNLGLDLEKLRQEVTRFVQPGADLVKITKLPQTPRAKKVIEYAMEEARTLNHRYVGSEHMLLGLLHEKEGVACQVLANVGLELDDVRNKVLSILGPSSAEAPQEKPSTRETEDAPPDLVTAVVALNAEIERLTSEKEKAIAEQDVPSAGQLHNRSNRLKRTKAFMVWHWISIQSIEQSWLSFNQGTVLNLAQQINDQRRWQDLPKLADALEAAGCTDTAILGHLRQPGEHTRHCWVVDVLLAHT